MEYLAQEIVDFTTTNITESTAPWNNSLFTAGAFVVGKSYSITAIGTTNFTLIGAAANTVGLIFTATGVGVGTGTANTAYLTQEYALSGTYIYKCVSTHTNKLPDDNVGIFWVKWSVSNKFAMLDLSAQSKSTFTGGNLQVTFPQNRMTTLALGYYSADYVLVEILDAVGVVIYTYNSGSSVNMGVFDYYTYIYATYGYEADRTLKVPLPLWGSTIRCTFFKSANALSSSCGFLIGGAPVFMGQTLFGVGFSYNSFAVKNTDDFGTLTILKRAVQDKVDFETVIENTELSRMRREIKRVYNDIVCFIVEDESSNYENLITLGTIESAGVVLSNPKLTTMTFSVIEAI